MTRRTPDEYVWDQVAFDETPLGKNLTSPRREKIQFVVVHHMAMVGQGDGKANDACLRTWQSRQASAHYGVDGIYVRQFVWDSDAAWATANGHGNHAGISIEHANSSAGPKWLVSMQTLTTSARLVANLHRVYGLGRPVAGVTLRRHRDFYRTACPGPYLGTDHWASYVALCQHAYDELGAPSPTPSPQPPQEDPMPFPADILGPHFQKMTLCVDGPDSGNDADEVVQPRWAMYTSQYVRTASDRKSVILTCYHGGATTPGSHNPRTEGRETRTNGSLIEWDGRKGTHHLRAVMSVNELTPVKPQVVLMQIHNAVGDVATIRAEGVKDANGRLTDRVKLYGAAGDTSHYALLGEVKLTERFTIGLDVAAGKVSFLFNGVHHAKKVTATGNCYYKLGNYLQSNPATAPGESTKSRSVVRLFEPPELSHAA